MRHQLFLACHLLVVTLNVYCNLSIDRCNRFLLPMLKKILRLQQTLLGPQNYDTDIGSGLPDSISTIISLLHLKPTVQSLICCSGCFACYSTSDYPDFCNYQAASDLPVCGRPLTRIKKRRGVPALEALRKFHYQEFREWLGRMLCAPGMEEKLDRNVFDTGALPGELWDIWDGEVLSNFCGADGAHFIRDKRPGEGRYVFAISMDGFNPFFNKAAGKSYSAGAIVLVCLNLPPEIRYLRQNIFVFCVFPGPKEPRLHQINNLLKYLVEDFLVFWSPGVYYAETPNHPEGRLVRAAIVPLLADLLAARKMSGINQWCTQCPLKADDIDNLELETWPRPLTCDEHRALAVEWESLDSRARNRHFKKHGIRWSELLRLPYWDPVRFTVIEFSHNISNNAERHLRVLFGMDAELPDGLGDQEVPPEKKIKEADPLVVEDAWEIVNRESDAELQKLPGWVLAICCRRAGYTPGGKKQEFIRILQQYVSALCHLQ